MIRKGIALIVMLLIVGMNVVSSTSNFVESSYIILRYTPHEPIYIHGNDNFTIKNGVTGGSGISTNPYTIEGWMINASYKDGIIIRNVTVYFAISNCIIKDGGANNDGIVFINVEHGVINDSIITKNRNGIMFRTQYSGKENSENNSIHNNNISNNVKDGIHFQHTGWGHHKNNLIYFNNITGNNQGIYMIMSAYNHIFSNDIISNSELGINLSKCLRGGENNRIYHNNFANNGNQNGQAYERGWNIFNYWDDGYPSGGNYWSDYNGVDNFSGPNQNIPGSDGIGDISYPIFNATNEDSYPWMEPIILTNDTRPPITNITFNLSGPNGDNGWYVSDIYVKLKAIDDDIGVKEIYYRINGEDWEKRSGSVVNFILKYDCLIDGWIEFYAVDYLGNKEETKFVGDINIDKLPPEINYSIETDKENGTWFVSFSNIAYDECSGMDRVEVYINDALQEIIIGIGPEYIFNIMWSKELRKVTFNFYFYDSAGNIAILSINGSDIESYPYSQYYNKFFIRWLERFPLLQKILDVLKVNLGPSCLGLHLISTDSNYRI